MYKRNKPYKCNYSQVNRDARLTNVINYTSKIERQLSKATNYIALSTLCTTMLENSTSCTFLTHSCHLVIDEDLKCVGFELVIDVGIHLY
jgi:hypothetical protein